jgi:hypothetical protein
MQQKILSATMSINHAPANGSNGHAESKQSLTNTINGNSAAMDLDSITVESAITKKHAPAKRVPSEASTRATSPKPPKAKEQLPPPPPPPGSGILSATLFGGDSNTGNTDTGKASNIVLHIDIKKPGNQVINFARLAEEKYGFAALYPRQAAQKERLAKVAAAGAALERSGSGSRLGGVSAGESGDEDLSVDIDRESDNDGDIAMTGVNGGQDQVNSGTDNAGTKQKRRRKQEEYDQDDPFVDDTEMLWEAQAAASKDGFFVYCGPLVPEGEKPAVERYDLLPLEMFCTNISRADGTIKRGRGRGRGGGPGSRGGRASAATNEGGTGRGGGTGSRGGGVTRKPRITKAEREKREQEKRDREKMATVLPKPSAYPA